MGVLDSLVAGVDDKSTIADDSSMSEEAARIEKFTTTLWRASAAGIRCSSAALMPVPSCRVVVPRAFVPSRHHTAARSCRRRSCRRSHCAVSPLRHRPHDHHVRPSSCRRAKLLLQAGLAAGSSSWSWVGLAPHPYMLRRYLAEESIVASESVFDFSFLFGRAACGSGFFEPLPMSGCTKFLKILIQDVETGIAL